MTTKPKPKLRSAPLVRDGQSLVIGSLATGARYEPRCLVCDAWLTLDETPPRYPVPICAGCVRARSSSEGKSKKAKGKSCE